MVLQVNIKRTLGLPSTFGTADMVHVHPSLMPGNVPSFATYEGHKEMLMYDVQIQGMDANNEPLDDPFGQVGSFKMSTICNLLPDKAKMPSHMTRTFPLACLVHWQGTLSGC